MSSKTEPIKCIKGTGRKCKCDDCVLSGTMSRLGKRSAERLTSEQRTARARKAAEARWRNKK